MTWTYKPHLKLMMQIQFSVKKGGWVGVGDSLKSN